MKQHWVVRAAGWWRWAEVRVWRALPVIIFVSCAYFGYALAVASKRAWVGWMVFGLGVVVAVVAELSIRQTKRVVREVVRERMRREAEVARAVAKPGEIGWRLRTGCEVCGGSPIAVAAGGEDGGVVAVCGACGFGWTRGTGRVEEMLSPTDWCARVRGRLAPASLSAAEEAFGAEQIVEIAPGEWSWDWDELSDWADGVRAGALVHRAEQHGRSGPMV